MGFSTCPLFFNGIAKEQPEDVFFARFELCPRCWDLEYDRNYMRQVVAIRRGWKVGTGPDRRDKGVEIFCCVVM
jgi:hypothetical protein